MSALEDLDGDDRRCGFANRVIDQHAKKTLEGHPRRSLTMWSFISKERMRLLSLLLGSCLSSRMRCDGSALRSQPSVAVASSRLGTSGGEPSWARSVDIVGFCMVDPTGP
eukprot:8401385-Pyramimonas_sp.AAC.1